MYIYSAKLLFVLAWIATCYIAIKRNKLDFLTISIAKKPTQSIHRFECYFHYIFIHFNGPLVLYDWFHFIVVFFQDDLFTIKNNRWWHAMIRIHSCPLIGLFISKQYIILYISIYTTTRAQKRSRWKKKTIWTCYIISLTSFNDTDIV